MLIPTGRQRIQFLTRFFENFDAESGEDSVE